MGNAIRAVAATAAVIGLVAGCGGKADSGGNGSSSSAPTSTSAAASASPAQLQALVPTPGGTAQTWGPDPIGDNGIHLSFKVTGAPTEVVTEYKAALEGKGWAVTTIVSSDGGPGGWRRRHLHRHARRQLRCVRRRRDGHRDIPQRVRLAGEAGPAELQPQALTALKMGFMTGRSAIFRSYSPLSAQSN